MNFRYEYESKYPSIVIPSILKLSSKFTYSKYPFEFVVLDVECTYITNDGIGAEIGYIKVLIADKYIEKIQLFAMNMSFISS